MSGAPAHYASEEQRLIEQFYDWELRGRGWHLYPMPIALEPPFRPFFGHYLRPQELVDDGRRPTVISSVYEWLTKGKEQPSPKAREIEEPEPAYLDEIEAPVEIQVAMPRDLQIPKEIFEQFLLSLPRSQEPMSFEIVGTPRSITALVAAPRTMSQNVRLQLEAHFPDAVFHEVPGLLSDEWSKDDGECIIAEYGLAEEFMIPFQTLRNLNTDPLTGITGSLGDLKEGEFGIMQVLFQPVRHPWSESLWNAVTHQDGDPFFINRPDLLSQAKAKMERPLHAVVLRVAAKAKTSERTLEIARSLGSVFRFFSHPSGNSLIPLNNDGYDFADHLSDLILRRSRRSGMLLNTDELLSLVHLPAASVRSPKLVRQGKRTKALPSIADNERGLVLGVNEHGGKTRTATITAEQRVQHAHIIGASGTGKSTLLFNLILQDIKNGEGIGVLDPHGDLIEKILGHIPEDRIDDVVLLDASDEDYPIGFNILSAHSSLEKTLLASDLASVFRRLSTSWGDQMTSVLGNALLAFLESERGGTLIDLRRFLIEPDFRTDFLKTVTDSEVVYFWKKEFPLISGRPHVSLLSRLNTFLRPKPIRYMVGQMENRLDFAEIMNSGKIFLAKLPQGEIGEENAYLLGTLLVSKFQQLVIARQAMRESLRRDFSLYIDECHHFLTPSMATILSGARKYRLGLFLAHQELHQLEKDADVGSAVRGNPYTRICFRVGDQDARRLEEGFSFFEAKDLQNLERGEAICRVERSDGDFNLSVLPPSERESKACDLTRERAIAASRQRYGTPRALVEALLEPRVAASPAPPIPVEKLIVKQDVPKVVIEPVLPPNPPQPAKAEVLPEPAVLGRGGKEHKYLQHLIKQLAIGLNFEVEVEKEILKGAGSVDVLVKRGERFLAFEISVTTSLEHEIENIQKCFKAGFHEVVVVCLEEGKLEKMREAVISSFSAERERISFCLPDHLSGRLMELAAKCKGTESVTHGRKTKVAYRPLSPDEAQARRETLAKVTAQSLKKLKPKS